MIDSARSPVALAARIVAVAFALCVLGYFVVTAQQRANAPDAMPVVVPTDPDAAATPATESAGEHVFLPGTKSLQLGELNSPALGFPGSAENPGQQSHVSGQPFLHGSKSGVITDITTLEDLGWITAEEGESAVPIASPVVPAPPAQHEPHFLPSSKSRTQSLLAPRPTLVPGTTTTGQPVAAPPKEQRVESAPVPKR